MTQKFREWGNIARAKHEASFKKRIAMIKNSNDKE